MTDYEISKIDELSRAVRDSKTTYRSNSTTIIDVVMVGAFIYVAYRMFSPYISQASGIFKYLK